MESTRSISARSAAKVLAPTLDGERPAGTPAYRRLADAILKALNDGHLVRDTRLPSERELALALGVSRTTVTRAYAALRDSGHVRSRPGSGTVLTLPPGAPRSSGPISPRAPGDVIDLTCAAPEAIEGTAEALERAVALMPELLRGTGYSPLGIDPLREAIAERYCARGLPTTPDEIMVTNGALAGAAIVCDDLLGPGDRALVESPTYPNALAALQRGGVRLALLPMTPDGWDLDGMTALLRQAGPRLAYLVPDHQNPTGHLMDSPTRERVAGLLRSTRTTPLVDESHVDIHFDGTALPEPLAAHHPDAISVGSVSKSYWGGLRVGWIRARANVIERLLESRLTLDLGSAPLEQLAAAELLRRHDELMPRRIEQLRARRDALVTALHDRLPGWHVESPSGGLALWARLPEALADELVREAASLGVALVGPAHFTTDAGLRSRIRVPFTQPVDTLVEAAERLPVAWERALRGRHDGRGPRPSPVIA